jgi:hypothetical protein
VVNTFEAVNRVKQEITLSHVFSSIHQLVSVLRAFLETIADFVAV